MRSLVFAVVLVLVAPLTVVRSEMNSSLADDPTLHRDDRGFFPDGDEPWVIKHKGSAAVFNNRAMGDLNSTDEQPSQTKRGQVDIGYSRNTAVFNKRGTINFHNHAGERPPVIDEAKVIAEALNKTKTKRGQVDIGYSRNTAVFNKRGQVDIGYSRNTAVFNKRGQVDIGYSRNTAVFNKRGQVDIGYSGNTAVFNKRGQVDIGYSRNTAVFNKRGYVGIGYSRNTSVFNKRGTHSLNSTVEEPMDDKRTKRGRVGIGFSGNTSIFNQRALNASISA